MVKKQRDNKIPENIMCDNIGFNIPSYKTAFIFTEKVITSAYRLMMLFVISVTDARILKSNRNDKEPAKYSQIIYIL